MAKSETIQALGRLIDGLYEGRDEVGRDEIYTRLEAEHAAPEVRTYFEHLPDGDYTIDELADEIGAEVAEADRTGDLGLLT